VSDGDDDLFRDAMSDVVPLKREERVRRDRRRSRDDGTTAARREPAMRDTSDDNPLLDEGMAIDPLDPWYVLEFKRPGVQNGVYRKLRQGRYEAEARLDLHRMSVARARRELYEFIRESHRLGLRSLLVIHGKGESRTERERHSILKGCTNHWLRELDVVQAFHSAQPRHGGTGAVYVLLRKSEAQKQATREQFAKGRVPFDPG